ncbi:YdbH domain-containing protein [Neptuniibacter sp. CAU 1671]|uniref:YdbH domain-containing protein n=1 Tax=Neptuniibacter sp. CAU 1671 TaxID=3032593 RepID=UPI0023DB438D|nr:YdbH domain-containing protein [Neptuniibacter sp. CAU 1671]MDF2180980.1 YdbH domain-containing protein [Neptuniibacter sp. CAU 1671]
MRVRRIISLSLLLLLLAVVPLSYLLSPMLGRYLIEQWFQQRGFTDVQFQINHPGWGQLDIPGISLGYQTPDFSLKLDTGAIRISYDPYRLLLSRQLTSVALDEASVTLNLTDNATQPAPVTLAQFSTLLPAVWLPELPADQIRLDQLMTQVSDTQGQRWQGTHQIRLDPEQAQVNSQISSAQLPELTSHLSVTPDNHFIWQLEQNTQPLTRLEGQLTGPNELQTRLTLQLEQSMPLLKRFLPDLTNTASVQGTLNSQGRIHLPEVLDLSANPLNGIETEQQFELSVQVKPQTGELTTQLSGKLQLKQQRVHLTLAENSKLQLNNWPLEGLSRPLGPVSVALRKTLEFQAPLNADLLVKQLSVSPASFNLSSVSLEFNDLHLTTTSTQLDLIKIDPATGAFEGVLSPTLVTVKNRTQTFPAVTLKTEFESLNKTLQQQFSLSADQPRTRITGSANTDLDSMNSQIRWQTAPINLRTLATGLKPWLPQNSWPKSLVLKQGTLQHQGSANIRNSALRATFSNRISDAEIEWQQNQLSGLNWTSTTHLNPDNRWHDTGEVKLARFKKGVELNNLDLAYRYEGGRNQDSLRVEKAAADFLAGHLSLQPFTTRLQAPDFETQLRVNNISLEQLLALEQQRGLSGNGVLNGTVPLTFSEGALTIAGGKLVSEAPGGTLRFQPDQNVLAYAAANKGLSMALELLQNFHYQQLSVDLSYAADGNALLKTRLQGFNPDWSNGQPIDFNINIEENILQLIRALQLAEQLTEQIEQHYSQ